MSKKHKHKSHSNRALPPQKGQTYAQKLTRRERELWEAGIDTGLQMGIDYSCLYLHDKAKMGKDAFGIKRMKQYVYGVSDIQDELIGAFTDHVDADVKQRDMDEGLRQVFGKELVIFPKRYPYIRMYGYEQKRRGWVDND